MRGRINRREAIAGLGSVGLGALVAACGASLTGATTAAEVTTTAGATATVEPQTMASSVSAAQFDEAAFCTLSPELTEGPYYFEVDSIRSDIREDREGVTLRLAVRVRDAASCTALPNSVVDIWHCDAVGLYSGFEGASTGGPSGGGGGPSDDETYLRGAQVTNNDGVAAFVTVYPGWYRGRTTHIHAKVHLDNSTLLTTQVFFDEDITAAVYANEPYASDSGRDTFNDNDGIFDERLVLTLSEDGDSYLGLMTFDVASA